jgi:hypothetical protein
MVQQQTVTGLFDNAAEAQQAVQTLLGSGFKADQITFSLQKDSDVDSGRLAPTTHERNTGRFLTALFSFSHESGIITPGRDDIDKPVLRAKMTSVTVQVQSLAEGDQAAHLLTGARSVSIAPL